MLGHAFARTAEDVPERLALGIVSRLYDVLDVPGKTTLRPEGRDPFHALFCKARIQERTHDDSDEERGRDEEDRFGPW